MNNHPDFKKKVCLVTRPGEKGQALCAAIAASGGGAIHFPTLAFAPPPDETAFRSAIRQLGEQDWILFISPQAVTAALPAINRNEIPETVKWAAIGAGTAQRLQEAGYNAVYPTVTYNSEGLLAMPAFQAVKNMKVAIVRGVGGRQKVDSVLTERGALVLPVIAYQRILPTIDIAMISQLLKQNEIYMIISTSFDSVAYLKTLLGEANWKDLHSLPLLVVSERIKMLAQDLGFQRIWVTKQASEAAILEAVAEIKDHLS